MEMFSAQSVCDGLMGNDTGGPARASRPGQLPSTGQTGLTFRQLQFTPVLDGSAPMTSNQDTLLSTSSVGGSSLLLQGRPHVHDTPGPSPAAAAATAAAGPSGSGPKEGRKPVRAAQLEAMLALHMEHSGPCDEGPMRRNDESGMAQDDEVEVGCSAPVQAQLVNFWLALRYQ